ncbi:MAG: competence/damage-inducible protein A [Marinilabiliaceae bacterium]|nr:competence/damage-inducible protein A [Marinilabiliaceae bacterium]
MQVEIITIGDEILIGQIIDTNSAWMGQELNNLGFDINRITSISDNKEEIENALAEALNRVSIVLITGGLGPTRDDITKHVLCDFFKTKLVFNETVYNNVVQLLKGRVKTINELNRSQAMVPENCTVIQNTVGTAPIMWFEKEGKAIISMPGVPFEMKHAMNNEILPRLTKQFKSGVIIHKTIHIYRIPEAVLAEMLTEWEDSLPSQIKIAYLPQPGKIRLRLTAKGSNRTKLEKQIFEATEKLYPIIGNQIYGIDDESPQLLIGKELLKLNHTISTAESCSGGTIASLITSIPGASAYFKGSIVAYSNKIKQTILCVSESNIIKYGAVSKEVVEEMALGVKKIMNTNWAIATSGIAGPTGGSDEKPVGTVWIAIASPDNNVYSELFSLGKIRERVISQTSETALIMLLNNIIKYK